MVYGSLKGEYGSVLSQVWSDLENEVRQQAIQLLVQLAFNLVVSQSVRSSAQEKDYAQVRFS
jgi:hypothetical protein